MKILGLKKGREWSRTCVNGCRCMSPWIDLKSDSSPSSPAIVCFFLFLTFLLTFLSTVLTVLSSILSLLNPNRPIKDGLHHISSCSIHGKHWGKVWFELNPLTFVVLDHLRTTRIVPSTFGICNPLPITIGSAKWVSSITSYFNGSTGYRFRCQVHWSWSCYRRCGRIRSRNWISFW